MQVDIPERTYKMYRPNSSFYEVVLPPCFYVVCDNCVVGSVPWLYEEPDGLVSEIRFKGLNIEDALHKYPGLTCGTIEQAISKGWMEADFGMVCPTCIAEQSGYIQRVEDDEVQLNEEELSQLTGALLGHTLRAIREEKEE